VVAGGDGTVNCAASVMVDADKPLGVLPLGTLNHFAKDHGIPTDHAAAAEVSATGETTTADVATVNGRVFLNTSSVGLYANFVRVRERLEGRFGYWLSSAFAVVRTFARARAFHLSFETEGLHREYRTPLAFIGVGERDLKLPTLGGRVHGGRDGLHVLIVRGRTRARLLALSFAAAARGTRGVTRTPHLDGFVVTRCVIEQRHSTVAVDGEIVKLDSPLEYVFGHRALRIVVPREVSTI